MERAANRSLSIAKIAVAIHIKPDGSVEFLQTSSVITRIVEDVDPVYI
ncbi:hypothetical protein [Sinorhizobium fredii]|nr:hypothetical protein [Sinorhizobium fredii]